MRLVERTYRDPLDEIWIGAARRIGLAVVRSADVYAATDGRGTLALGTPETLDADDSLAQMIFHELCHSLVEGPESLESPDWGLCNQTDRHVVREQASLRLQAALSAPWGLRWFLAPTTEHRAFYDALPPDPLEPRLDPSAVLARRGAARSEGRPWGPHVADALAATLAVVRAAAPFAAEGSLAARVEPARGTHPVGPLFLGAEAGAGDAGAGARGCGGCGWAYRGGPGKAVLRCRQANGARVEATWPACERWETALDCQDCGACCREAYHSVTVPARDPVVKKHPALVVRREGRVEMGREGGRCVALAVDGDRYACRIYEDRPSPCRGFELGSDNCLTARRRVGLSR